MRSSILSKPVFLAIIKMVAAQRGVDVDKARGPVKLALKKMVATNQVKQLKVRFQISDRPIM